MVHPKSSRNSIDSIQGNALKIHITAPPVEGAANEAVVSFLAKTWRIPKKDVSLVQGLKSRHKVIFLPYDLDRVVELIEKALDTPHRGKR
ncbi:MAG: YggU family protein [Deltaproteobacteria bacterium]|nr:YggU family protein [Deltaproteobacteria bacterium]